MLNATNRYVVGEISQEIYGAVFEILDNPVYCIDGELAGEIATKVEQLVRVLVKDIFDRENNLY